MTQNDQKRTNEIKYYGNLCSMFYDLDKPQAPDDEIDFYKSFAKQGDKILEPMCGSGRLLVPFVNSGYDIEGFDLSQDMLNQCLEKIQQQNIVTKADFVTFESDKRYDYIFIAASSICLLLTDKDLQNALNKMKSLLKDTGTIVFGVETTLNAESMLQETEPRYAKAENISIKLSTTKNTFDKETCVFSNENVYELYENNKLIEAEKEIFSIRLHDMKQLDEFLQKNNFIIKNKYADYNFTKATEDDLCYYYELKIA